MTNPFQLAVQIIDGYMNKIISGTPLANEEVEHLAKLRMEICEKCEIASGETPLAMTKCLSPSKTCCKCGCHMPAKTRSLHSTCPLNKW